MPKSETAEEKILCVSEFGTEEVVILWRDYYENCKTYLTKLAEF